METKEETTYQAENLRDILLKNKDPQVALGLIMFDYRFRKTNTCNLRKSKKTLGKGIFNNFNAEC